MSNTERVARLAVALSREQDGLPLSQYTANASALVSIAKAAQRAEIMACNIPNTCELRDKRIKRLSKRARDILTNYPLARIRLGGDARGACAVITFGSGQSYGWSSDQWEI